MGKQELAALRREGEKLRRNLEGIRDMQKLPDAIIIIDTTREAIAVAEAQPPEHPDRGHRRYERRSEPVSYPIAGNDDAIRAIRILLQKLVDGIVNGGGESAPAARKPNSPASANSVPSSTPVLFTGPVSRPAHLSAFASTNLTRSFP